MKQGSGRKLTKLLLGAMLLATCFSIFASPQAKKPDPQKPTDEYHRPAPKGPTTPTMPSENRYQQGKVFLEAADSLFRTDLFQDIKIVKGNVKFSQAGAYMYCDSAYFYAAQDRADCFGNVRLVQGDTLFIYADRLYYNGIQQFARLRCGPTAKKVRLINGRDTLITDSLDYNLATRLGWYDKGGELKDRTMRLTSLYGEYSPRTKNAEFFHNVVLVNKKDKYTLRTDTLYYNTRTHIARIDSRTIIEGKNDTIITTGGTYNTQTGKADLTKRSIILHRDSNQNVVTLEGDSIIYDKNKDLSRAFTFRSPFKKGQPVILTDTANKSILIGGYGYYDNRNRKAMATHYPLLMEYSRGDTLFLRADTIRTQIKVSEAVTDSAGNIIIDGKEYYEAKAYNRARFFRPDVQGVADSITFVEIDSMLYLNRKPMVWSGERQVNGRIIEVHLNDTTADWVRLPDTGTMMEHVEDEFYNQLSGKELFATIKNNSIDRLQAEGNVKTVLLPEEEDSTYNKLVKTESDYLDAIFSEKDIEKLKLWPQVTGSVIPLADVKETDIMLPSAVWREDIRPIRQWYGDKIKWADIHDEITDELEEYFSTPEPGGSRGAPPANSRPVPVPSKVRPTSSSVSRPVLEEKIVETEEIKTVE